MTISDLDAEPAGAPPDLDDAAASDPTASGSGRRRAPDPASPAAPAALLRVSVRCGGSRVDLAIPGNVAVAELLPDLAAELGVLDASVAHAGYRLVTADGITLDADCGLAPQDVLDGDTLVVALGIDDDPPAIYDDVVEAVAHTIERVWRPWDAAAARWTALIAAAALLGVGAVALGLARDEGVPVLAGGAAAAALLLAAGVALVLARGETLVGTTLAWLAAPYAAAAGLAAAPDDPVLRLPLCIAGGGVVAVGLIGMVAIAPARAAFLPPLIVGVAAAASGGVLAGADDAEPGAVAAVVLVLGVIAGLLLPMFALANSGLRAPDPQDNSDLTATPEPIRTEDVEARVRLGRELSLGLAASVALLVVLGAPMAVDLGVEGAALAGAAALCLLLRTRQYRTWGEVAVGVGGGVGGLVALVVSATVLHPDWRPALGGIGAAAGVVVIASVFLANRPSLRLGRAADLAENGTVIALLPLLAIASGLFERVRDSVT